MAWPRVYTRTNSKFEGISFFENCMAKGVIHRSYSIFLTWPGQGSMLDKIWFLNAFNFKIMVWQRLFDQPNSKFVLLFFKWHGKESMLDKIRNSNLLFSMAWPRVYTQTKSKFEGIKFSENCMAKGLYSTKPENRMYTILKKCMAKGLFWTKFEIWMHSILKNGMAKGIWWIIFELIVSQWHGQGSMLDQILNSNVFN